MRLYEISDSAQLPTLAMLKQLRPEMVQVAQHAYDAWDEEERDTYAGGGICHIIADAILDVLYQHNITATTQSSSHEQHVYVVAQVEEGVYMVDIHHSIYERGGGFSWTKVPDVVFEPDDITFYRISGDPDEFDQITAEY